MEIEIAGEKVQMACFIDNANLLMCMCCIYSPYRGGKVLTIILKES